MKILIRADSSHRIGSGHVMRCMTLARALRERGSECCFVSREHPGNLIPLIKQNGFPVVVLPNGTELRIPDPGNTPRLAHCNWLGTDWESDAGQVVASMDGVPVDWLIVDHYALDIKWEQRMRPHVMRIMVIDDLADREHDCDLLLDQNLMQQSERRYVGLLPAHCIRLLGPRFAVLQPEYLELQPQTLARSGPVRRILVYFGGADQDNLTGMTLSAILENQRSDLVIDVVINPDGAHAKSIRQQARGSKQVHVHERLPSLAELMFKADLSIGAGGTTSWERCCLGLPTIVITLSENQRPIAEALAQKGVIRWLGHYDNINQRDISQALETVLNDGPLSDWSHRCRSLVDGNGTRRIAEILCLNSTTPIRARYAEAKDEAFLLDLANDPLVRLNSFYPSQIDEITHQQWFQKRLRNPDHHRIYILETNSGFVIGQVRFDLKGDEWEVGFSLVPEARSRGLSKPLLECALQHFSIGKPPCSIFGRVKLNNIRSQKAFEKLGFVSTEEDGILIYRRKP